jgi:cell shape-determining protein MreC
MSAIVINFHTEFRFHAGKHSEVDGLCSIGVPFVSITFWSSNAYTLLITAVERTFRNKEFIVKDSKEWYEKVNAASQEYKDGEQKRHKDDLRSAWDTINTHLSRINDLENENRTLRKVIKICSEDELAKFERAGGGE